MQNYKDKYLKYKLKYINLKKILNGGNDTILNPLKDMDLDKLEITKDNIYPSITDIKEKCKNDILPEKEFGFTRLLLFNVNEFISVCDTKDENSKIGRNIDDIIKFINDSKSDIALLNNIVPNYDELPKPITNQILKDNLDKINHKKLIDNINLKNTIISRDTAFKNKYYGNAIMSKDAFLHKEEFDLGNGKKLLITKVKIYEKDIMILLTNLNKSDISYLLHIVNLIKKIKELKSTNKYVILSGNFDLDDKDLNNIKNELINIENDNKKITLTNMNVSKIHSKIFISEDLIIDFDINMIINKNNLSLHYPVIFDIKYINTTVKDMESLLQLMFYTMTNTSILKKFKKKIYYTNKSVRGHLYIDDPKFKFTNYEIILKTETDKSVKDDNDESYTKEQLLSLLNTFKNKLYSDKRFLLLIQNFFSKINGDKENIIKNCYESVCKFIGNVNNFKKDELDNLLINENPLIVPIIDKYYEVKDSDEMIEIFLFGFKVLKINFENVINDTDYDSYLTDPANSWFIKLKIIKLNNEINNFLGAKIHIKDNNKPLIENQNSKNINSIFYGSEGWEETEPGVFKEVLKPYEIKSNIDKDFVDVIQMDYISKLKKNKQNKIEFLYDYTLKMNNLIRELSLGNYNDKLWIDIYINKPILNDEDIPYKLSDVVIGIDNIFRYAPKTTNTFNVWRATTLLNLFSNSGINLYETNNIIGKKISIKYYQSTTLDGYNFLASYTDELFPVIFNITIPINSKVLCLGKNAGLEAQVEVLLDRNCELEITDIQYKNLDLRDKIYAMIINCKYIKE